MNRVGRSLALVFALIGWVAGCGGTASEQAGATVSPDQAEAIAKEAYIWGFPVVMNYKTLYSYTLDTGNAEYKGPFNQLSCEARLFTPGDAAIVTPNSDTPYCMYWMDLRAEPMVLTVPELEPERFYHFQLIDLYTHNYAYVGTLTTGNGAGAFLLAGPDWSGETPQGIDRVIRSETDLVFTVARTQLFGPDDLDRVREIQSAYGLQPLSAFLGTEAAPAPVLPDLPPWIEGAQFDERFFSFLHPMMGLLEEPAPGREELWARLARLGIGPGGRYDFAALAPEIQEAVKRGVKEGFAGIEEFVATHSKDPLVSGKLFGTRDFLTDSARTNYQLDNADMLRAAAAHTGLYGNSAAEAVYPTYFVDAAKQPLNAASSNYTVTFAAGQLPPVRAFWSLTMYDGASQLLVPNPLERYLLNSPMLDQLRRGDDGSLTLYIQKNSPGRDEESNWLPAPDGPFYMVLRLYGPEPEALEGRWTPPPAVPTPTS